MKLFGVVDTSWLVRANKLLGCERRNGGERVVALVASNDGVDLVALSCKGYDAILQIRLTYKAGEGKRTDCLK